MSRMMLRSNGKPPLARSPIRLRPRRKALQPTPTNNTNIHTPPGSLTKSQLPNRNQYADEQSSLRPEYHTISCELRALAKMVHQEFAPMDEDDDDKTKFGGGILGGSQRSPLFERGRLYDEYSARRNERLKRKKKGDQMEGYDKKPATYGLGVRVESAKKRGEPSKFDSSRKTRTGVVSTPLAEKREACMPRYSLRSSSKENKKPPIPFSVMNGERSVGATERKVGVRRIRKV